MHIPLDFSGVVSTVGGLSPSSASLPLLSLCPSLSGCSLHPFPGKVGLDFSFLFGLSDKCLSIALCVGSDTLQGREVQGMRVRPRVDVKWA